MKQSEPDLDLFARLEFLLAMTTRKYSGAELSILTRVTLGQPVSADELRLTGQGYKRALNALQLRRLLDAGDPPGLHPETCAEFGICGEIKAGDDVNWLRKLTTGTLQRRPITNLYLLNADGSLASDEQIGQLRNQLFEAAVLAAERLTGLKPAEIRREFKRPEMSLESEMRALASFVMGFIEGRFPDGLHCGLSHTIQIANSSLMAKFPRVLDPHALLERCRNWFRAADDRRIAELRRTERAKKRAGKQNPDEQPGATYENAAPPA